MLERRIGQKSISLVPILTPRLRFVSDTTSMDIVWAVVSQKLASSQAAAFVLDAGVRTVLGGHIHPAHLCFCFCNWVHTIADAPGDAQAKGMMTVAQNQNKINISYFVMFPACTVRQPAIAHALCRIVSSSVLQSNAIQNTNVTNTHTPHTLLIAPLTRLISFTELMHLLISRRTSHHRFLGSFSLLLARQIRS